MAPREQKRAISKIMVNQRRNEPPCYHRLAHHLAFTKSAQEPTFSENMTLPKPTLAENEPTLTKNSPKTSSWIHII